MSDDLHTEEIVRLVARYQRPLLAYIRSLLPLRADAEEVLQEVTVFIWRHAHDFRLGTDFAAWAYKIAYFQVLAQRKRMQRSRLTFSDELVEQLSVALPAALEPATRRQQALEECVKKLPAEDRKLVRLRYEHEAGMDRIATEVGRSIKTAYRLLNKIHLSLLDCVQNRLRFEEDV